MKTEQRTRILEVGTELFIQYGFKGTTMAEVARRAGISRPTLYAVFDSKEKLFVAVAESYTEQVSSEVMAACATADALYEKLATAFEIAFVRPFQQSIGSAFKTELLALDDPRINDAIARALESLAKVFTRVIKVSSVDLEPLGLTAPRLGRLLCAAAHGAKDQARNVKELRQMLSGLARIVSVATEKEGDR